MDGNFERIASLWMVWSTKTFSKADHISSLDKADNELRELREALIADKTNSSVLLEYADVIMCLLHSAASAGFTVEQIVRAIRYKSKVNFMREWELDESGNTYSHKK